MERVIRCALLLLLGGLLLLPEAQYEQYNWRSFPQGELVPLDSAYRYALEQYAAGNWRESVRYLELSLRLHRLLRESQAHCGAECGRPPPPPDPDPAELRAFGQILQRAACLRRCKRSLPVFQLAHPERETLVQMENRVPYKYLESAFFQLNNLEKSIAAAHTFLQKNPKDVAMQKKMNYYKSIPDIETYLVDVEAREYEALFLKAVKAYNNGNFRSSVTDMEHALPEYYRAHQECVNACEDSCDVTDFKDFYPSVAGHFVETVKCKVKCVQNLTPNVGGFFVEKFVATMYHYLQFAYYKLNDIKNAVSCVATYMLFDPGDEIMQQNVVYYRFYREKWGLQEEDFQPRLDAQIYYNLTRLQNELLEFADNFLHPDDEMEVSDEPVSEGQGGTSDSEFEGIGDYEEAILADWWQVPKQKGDVDDVAE
ncbi:endoplasmic reticulum protein SC65-like isoform X2 [Hypanus sabinus]|uniref:endoplasmic reticulum protein SC65-like isoform X2 n=1 Tax=Hypanus sabinus TaxID=79690 RepID=UPI0028C4DC85|nr:endoplasmic reticulum protein SC65-like isoform X2 [Hypanus sabinus]